MPEWRDEIRERLTGLKLEPAREAEIVEELAQHLEDRYAALLAEGSPHELIALPLQTLYGRPSVAAHTG